MKLSSIFNTVTFFAAAAAADKNDAGLRGPKFVSNRHFETTRRPLVLIDRVFLIAPILSSSGSSFGFGRCQRNVAEGPSDRE